MSTRFRGYLDIYILVQILFPEPFNLQDFIAYTKDNSYRINMRAVLLLVVLTCVLALTYGDLVCGSNYCKQNPCSSKVAASSCRSPSVYRANHAGKCACCPACVTLLSEGAACKAYSKELGETPSSVCKEPLKCISGACVKVAPRG